MNQQRVIAYFSMEIALEPSMPTYSGGLGVLAGDTIRSAADLKVPMVAVTLLYRKGYFYQRLDSSGWQTEEPMEWVAENFLEKLPQRISVNIEGRIVHICAWKYAVNGLGGFEVPVYLLDTDLPENADWDRTLTQFLYGGDTHYRLCQEVILGIGGVRMLRALGYKGIERFHMNEGHSSLLTVELLDEEARRAGRQTVTREDIESVRKRCIFTTHTPVPAGHDQFPLDLLSRVLGERQDFFDLKDVYSMNLLSHILGQRPEFLDLKDLPHSGNTLNMTYLALNLSHYVNGVAKKHGEVSRLMFAGYQIDAITNGVHAATWTAGPFQELYDRYLSDWKQDNFNLRSALSIPKTDIWTAHMECKKKLIGYVNHIRNIAMDTNVLTIGFARRMTAYKRPDLLLTDIEQLKRISAQAGPLQVIYGGKAHPQDPGGKEIIKHLIAISKSPEKNVRLAFLENYDIEVAKMMVSGVDLWLNTPQAPLEASGTSGMKAALNGVPSFSVLDGWWIEGHIEGVTGWAIGGGGTGRGEEIQDRSTDAASLYAKLEKVIIPIFYQDRDRFIDVMRHAIALNGSFFNTQRMLQQYVVKAYFV
jgi:starch phosphorylase